jgi:Ca-activated chloride channel homolog
LGIRLFAGLFSASMLLLIAPGLANQDDDAPPFRVDVDIVRVPVTVVDNEGRLYGGLERDAFTVLEDGAEREIVSFSGGESPLTLVVLLEHSRVSQYLLGEILRPAGVFVTQIMERGDYAALVAFDNRPRVLSDFTANRQQLLTSIQRLAQSPPAFRESNLFDALRFVLRGGYVEDVEYMGLAEVEGRTGVLLVATGLDTFSGITLDEARRVAANAGVPVYSVGVGELAFIRAEPHLSGMERMTFLQARNHLRTFSQESGGRFYSVRFPQAVDGVLESIAALLRFQYTLGFRPSDTGGGRREIEVLVDLDGDGTPDNERLDLSYRRYYHAPERSVDP